MYIILKPSRFLCLYFWSSLWIYFNILLTKILPMFIGLTSEYPVVLRLIHHIHLTSCQPTTTSSSSLTTFCRENILLQSAGDKKYFSRVHGILRHGFLCYRNTNLFLIGKNVLIVMVPILVNKDVPEPSYNDLKFMVRNSN